MSSSPICGLLLILNLQLFSTYPISTGLTDTDMDILKVSLNTFKAWLHYENMKILDKLQQNENNFIWFNVIEFCYPVTNYVV